MLVAHRGNQVVLHHFQALLIEMLLRADEASSTQPAQPKRGEAHAQNEEYDLHVQGSGHPASIGRDRPDLLELAADEFLQRVAAGSGTWPGETAKVPATSAT